MAFEITIPRLGWSMEEGTFVRWLKQDGDVVLPGDALFELEGEKAAQDIEAVDGGILRIPSTSPKPGTVVAVGAVIGFLVAENEAVPSESSGGRVALHPPATEAPVKVLPGAQLSAIGGSAAPAAPPSVRRMARELGVDLASVAGSGPAGRISADDVRAQGNSPAMPATTLAADGTSVIASPRARRVARELGVDWHLVTGTGRGGRVRECDIRAAGHGARAPSAGSSATRIALGTTIPVSRHRRTIAERMLYSRQHTAPVTLTTRVDATNLVNLRQQFKQSGGDGPIPSYSDIVTKLVALDLKQHPLLAARWSNDHLFAPAVINIGIAVDTDAGLMVPVVRDVPRLSLIELARQTQRLIAQTRSGKLTAADMQDGVFTITNLGAFGIDAFTPIINVPESAILGLGRIRREPAVVGNQIVPRDQMTLSLTFDHRVVDGAPAARFLQEVSQAIEAPSAWLLKDS
jgi:pyruvate dehydrogenase E2 component (dihydrolipoamide acetyltransferase)